MLCGAVLVAAAGFSLSAGPAAAQQPNPLAQPPALEPLPDTPAAPKHGDADRPVVNEKGAPPSTDDVEPVVTIRQEGDNKIEEFRVHGRLYAIRVTPRVGKPYTMVDADGKGRMERAESGADDPAGHSVRPPRWVLFEF